MQASTATREAARELAYPPATADRPDPLALTELELDASPELWLG